MSNKELKTRIQMKNDTAENWATASTNGFIPKLGEPIFYKEQDGDGFKFPKMKIGDGVRTPDELPSYSGSWDDLTDKPFGYIKFHSRFDRTTDEVVSFIPHGQRAKFFKVTDEFFDASEWPEMTIIKDEFVLDAGTPVLFEGGWRISNQIIVINQETVNLGIASDGKSDTFPATGTYVQLTTQNIVEVISLNHLKQLDEKYIPDTIARVSDIPEPQIQSDWNQTDDTQADFIKNKPTIPSIEGLATEEYVDNAIANAGGGSGGAGYGNAPIQKWEMNLTSDSDKTYSLAFTQTGPTIYEGNLFISVVDACGYTWTGGQNVTLLINGIDLTGYEIFKNIVVRPNKQWYWTTYKTSFSDKPAGQNVDTNAEFATSSSVTLQLYNRQGSSGIWVGTEDQCWGLKVKVDTNTRIISISIAEGGSVLF